MLASLLLYGLLVIATATDLRWGVIYNWTTYTGIALAVLLSGLPTLLPERVARSSLFAGQPPWSDCLAGLFACGAAMLVCYVFFPGGVGGGDLKLIAMIGAFTGLRAGLEAMLWTMVFGGCLGLIVLIWQVGAVRLFTRGVKYVLLTLRLGGVAPLTAEEKQPLRTRLPLSAAALLAVIVVRWDWIEWF